MRDINRDKPHPSRLLKKKNICFLRFQVVAGID
jgi:hypothetical protein